jgi:hypothetical protein
MAGRRSPVTDVRELVRRLRMGEPDRRIARDLGVSRNTVARYRGWAQQRGLLTGELPPLGRARPRGDRGGSELCPDVRDAASESQDGSPGRARFGRGVLGAYRRAHRVSDAQRHVRGRLGVRDALVRTRTRYIALIRARLRQDGWRMPTGTAEGFTRRVLALPLPGRLRSEIAPLLAVMRQVNHQVAYSDERIAALTATDARVRRLQSLSNIGPVTAAAFVAALDDAQRFRRAHQVEAYVGLVPREWRSRTYSRAARQSVAVCAAQRDM